MRRLANVFGAIAIAALGLVAPCSIPRAAAQHKPVAYTKSIERIAMRDGVHLATDIYLPKPEGRFPVILLRTPYNKTGVEGIADAGTKRGYAVVAQDTRGRFASEGENLPFEGDGWWAKHADGAETLAWIARQKWCNGKIGTMGGSALGITQLGEAGTGTPHISAQQIVVAAPSPYAQMAFPGGVFKKAMIEDWLRATQHAPNALAHWAGHPTYDSFWKEREFSTRWGKANAPAVHLGGWYDIFGQGTIDSFLGFQNQGGEKARGKQVLVMGPWTHGVLQKKAGELVFPNGAAPPHNIADAWQWFDYHLKGEKNSIASAPSVVYYTMGDVSDAHAPGNVWRSADRWPPFDAPPTPYYLQPDRTLSAEKPKTEGAISYRYDPANPAPTVGGPQLTLPSGPMDQRALESRPDVIAFTSAPLASPLEVTGRVRLVLWASSDAKDTDFFVKLCDVYPDGRSYNLCEGQIRTRFWRSFERESLLTPGKPYRFVIDLWSTSVVFNKGHRLRVLVTSSSSPGYDPNPNTGAAFRANAEKRVAQNTLLLHPKRPSYIELPIAPPR